MVKDQCIVAGGGIAANGSFVPGIPGSANDAAGNVKQFAAGKAELRRNCGGSLAFKGIPVTVYDREADMLADFFTECMEQKRRVAYINGDDVVRNDT